MTRYQTVGCIVDQLRPFLHPMDGLPDYVLSPDYYGYYFGIAKEIKPRSILEIGVRFGYSAASMLMGQGGTASYIGFDCESYNKGSNVYALQSLTKATRGKVDVVLLNTQTVTELVVPPEFLPLDIIHVDGAHEVSEMIHDLNLVKDYCHDDCHILVDDTVHHNLGSGCTDWVVENGFDCTVVPTLRGMMVLTRCINSKETK